MATELRPASDASLATPSESFAQVYESDRELVVLVRLHDGLLEVRVPRQAVSEPPPAEHHIPGFNPEATPC